MYMNPLHLWDLGFFPIRNVKQGTPPLLGLYAEHKPSISIILETESHLLHWYGYLESQDL